MYTLSISDLARQSLPALTIFILAILYVCMVSSLRNTLYSTYIFMIINNWLPLNIVASITNIFRLQKWKQNVRICLHAVTKLHDYDDIYKTSLWQNGGQWINGRLQPRDSGHQERGGFESSCLFFFMIPRVQKPAAYFYFISWVFFKLGYFLIIPQV